MKTWLILHWRGATASGLVVLLVGAFFFVPVSWYDEALARPLALEVGQVTSQPFHIKENGAQYSAFLRFEKTLPFWNLTCEAGLEPNGAKECTDIPQLIDFEWQLQDNGKTILSGKEAGNSASAAFADDVVVRHLRGSQFTGNSDHTYRLVVTFRANGTALQPANPKLVVGACYDVYNIATGYANRNCWQ